LVVGLAALPRHFNVGADIVGAFIRGADVRIVTATVCSTAPIDRRVLTEASG
jgi:hypothetical protein